MLNKKSLTGVLTVRLSVLLLAKSYLKLMEIHIQLTTAIDIIPKIAGIGNDHG